jgi:hypothetical protein
VTTTLKVMTTVKAGPTPSSSDDGLKPSSSSAATKPYGQSQRISVTISVTTGMTLTACPAAS